MYSNESSLIPVRMRTCHCVESGSVTVPASTAAPPRARYDDGILVSEAKMRTDGDSCSQDWRLYDSPQSGTAQHGTAIVAPPATTNRQYINKYLATEWRNIINWEGIY